MKKLFTAIAIAALAHCVATAPAKEIPAPAEWLRSNTITPEVQSTMTNNLKWYEGTSLTLEGRAFPDTLTSYSRLAVRHKASVTSAVWINGKASAGVTLRFVSDATSITAQWDCINPMPHMAWTGSGGLDLYYRDQDKWIYCGTGMPNATSTTAPLLKETAQVPPGPKEFLLFLPLYSPVTTLRLGMDPKFQVAPAPDRYAGKKPIVFYGTSITQGGCASRAGMPHPSLIRRWLDYPVINLGFSGSGKCEPAMADVLAEIPAAVYVIETVSNMTVQMIDERVVPLVKSLREKRPDTPIVMVESPNKDVEANAAWKRAFDNAKKAGMDKLDYVNGSDLYKGRENPTVDGSHPTDLGFYEMALTYEKVLTPLIDDAKN